LYRYIKRIVTVMVVVSLLTCLLGNLGNTYVAADVVTSDAPGVIVLGEMPASKLDEEKSFVTEGGILNENQLEMSIVPRYDVITNFKASDVCEFTISCTNYKLMEGDILRITLPVNVNIDTLTTQAHNDYFIQGQEAANIVTFTVGKAEGLPSLDSVVFSFQPKDVDGEGNIEVELIKVATTESINANSLPIKTMKSETETAISLEDMISQDVSAVSAEGGPISRGVPILGTFVIEKEVTELPGDTVDGSEEFEFWFMLSSSVWPTMSVNAIPYTITDAGGTVIEDSGVYYPNVNSGLQQVKLRHGDVLELHDIPLTQADGTPIHITYRVLEALTNTQEYDITADINAEMAKLQLRPAGELWDGIGVPATALGVLDTYVYDYDNVSTEEHVKFFNSKNTSQGTLTIKKILTGEMADTTLPFQFRFLITVGLDKQDRTFPYQILDADDTVLAEGEYDPWNELHGISGIVELKHNQRIVIDIQSHRSKTYDAIIYRVGEVGTVGYITGATVNSVVWGLEDDVWSAFIPAGFKALGLPVTLSNSIGFDEKVEFTNHRPAVPPTGITSLETPFWIMIIVALAMGIAYVVYKRKLRPNK